MPDVTKKGLKTIRVPPGLPAPKKAVAKSSNNPPAREPKTVQGEVVQDRISSNKSLPNKSKSSSTPKSNRLSAPDNYNPARVKATAKKVGGSLLKRAGAVGAIVSAGMAIHDAVKSDKPSSTKGAANQDSSGKSTKIEMTKKPVKPDSKPKTATTSKSSTKKSGSGFGSAFAAARKAGKKEFNFGGKKFHTRTKEEETQRKKDVVQKKGLKSFEKKFVSK